MKLGMLATVQAVRCGTAPQFLLIVSPSSQMGHCTAVPVDRHCGNADNDKGMRGGNGNTNQSLVEKYVACIIKMLNERVSEII